MRRQPLQRREARHHHDLQIPYVRLPGDALERDQNQVKNHQSHQQQPRILFCPVFSPVSQRHESSWRRRDGETEGKEDSISIVSLSPHLSVPLSLCPSVLIPTPPQDGSVAPSQRTRRSRSKSDNIM